MFTHLCVSKQWHIATKRIVVCCGFVCLSFLAIVGFGLLPKIQAAEKTLPNHRVPAAPTNIQPKLVPDYGKLPLSFEVNQGQTDARVRFLARGSGYTIFLTDDEAVLTLRKSHQSKSTFGKFGPPDRHNPFDLIDSRSGRWPSLTDGMNLLWQSLIPDLSQIVSDPNAGKSSIEEVESQQPQVVRMRLVGGNAMARVVGVDELPGRSNYFIGNDPKKWRTNVPSYAKVKYEGVYPGVDLVYYGNQRHLEYDLVVAPGADPNQIKLSFAGAEGIRVDSTSGDLVLKVGDDEVRFHTPVISQPKIATVNERPKHEEMSPVLGKSNPVHQAAEAISGAFVLASNNEVAFRVAGYDPQRALVIDPVLTYSTYLGGSSYDYGWGIAVDAAGNAYVAGYTYSLDFPTASPLQGNCNACTNVTDNAFVAKINPAGSALVYSTYLGGSGDTWSYGIASDAAGNAYVTGATYSTDFPTANPLQATIHGLTNAFVVKLNSSGSTLAYSTYLGGGNQDEGRSIAADAAGNAYVTGDTSSIDFPISNQTPGACVGTCGTGTGNGDA